MSEAARIRDFRELALEKVTVRGWVKAKEKPIPSDQNSACM
jgi:hypothetical protein